MYKFIVTYVYWYEPIDPMVISADSYVDAVKQYLLHPKNHELMECVVDPKSLMLDDEKVDAFIMPSLVVDDRGSTEWVGVRSVVFPFGMLGWRIEIELGEEIDVICCEWVQQHMENVMNLPHGTMIREFAYDEEKLNLFEKVTKCDAIQSNNTLS